MVWIISVVIGWLLFAIFIMALLRAGSDEK